MGFFCCSGPLPEAPRIGDSYRLGDILGRGGSSIVRQAFHKRTKVAYAVKILDKRTTSKEDMDAFRLETDILRSLDHPNIVKLFEIFETKKKLYVVMELLKGGALFDRVVKKRRYTEVEAAHVIRELGEGVRYLHASGVVHRDLKPENCIYLDEGAFSHIKIADFGLAKSSKNVSSPVLR